MSRCYDCYINIETETTKEENETIMEYTGDVTLYGGEDENEYTERIAREIWEKLKRFVAFTITMTYLEDLPYESYPFSNEDYYEYLQDKREEEEDAE